MQFNDGIKRCQCPAMPPPCCKPEIKPPKERMDKFYREIGTEMLGNQLIIRVERDKTKKRNRYQWDPPCDCIEIQRPTGNQGPKVLNRDTNTILFQVKSKTGINRLEDAAAKQSITYKVGACTGGKETNDQCRLITIHPPVEREGEQLVHTDNVTEGDESVFFLRIKRKPDLVDENTKNIELEVRTPRPPTPPPEPLLQPRKSKSSAAIKKKSKKKKR